MHEVWIWQQSPKRNNHTYDHNNYCKTIIKCKKACSISTGRCRLRRNRYCGAVEFYGASYPHNNYYPPETNPGKMWLQGGNRAYPTKADSVYLCFALTCGIAHFALVYKVPPAFRFSFCAAAIKNGYLGESKKNTSYTAFASSVFQKSPAIQSVVRSP